VRSLRVAPLPAFEETVTKAVPHELIEYRITTGGILRDHLGTMRFSSHAARGRGCDYAIRFGAVVPGLDRVVKKSLERSIPRAARGRGQGLSTSAGVLPPAEPPHCPVPAGATESTSTTGQQCSRPRRTPSSRRARPTARASKRELVGCAATSSGGRSRLLRPPWRSPCRTSGT
jgi:hypothetical protein